MTTNLDNIAKKTLKVSHILVKIWHKRQLALYDYFGERTGFAYLFVKGIPVFNNFFKTKAESSLAKDFTKLSKKLTILNKGETNILKIVKLGMVEAKEFIEKITMNN